MQKINIEFPVKSEENIKFLNAIIHTFTNEIIENPNENDVFDGYENIVFVKFWNLHFEQFSMLSAIVKFDLET